MSQTSKLTFPWDGVRKILHELNTATTARTLWNEDTGKGIWLVGDTGVYLMPNTRDGVHHGNLMAETKPIVVYAVECDPMTLAFDNWWETKRATFGGDDGVEFIALAEVERLAAAAPRLGLKPAALEIAFSANQFTLGIAWASAMAPPS